MEGQSNFFLTLPSNSSSKWFKDNKPQNYKVQLPQPLELEGKWEAALVELQYPRSWINMEKDSGATIEILRPDDLGSNKGQPMDEMYRTLYKAEQGAKVFEVDLLNNIKIEETKIHDVLPPDSIDLIHVNFPRGHYKSPHQMAAYLVDQANLIYSDELRAIKDIEKKKLLRFEYDEIRNQVSFHSDYSEINLILYRDELPPMIGFKIPIHGYSYHKFPTIVDCKGSIPPIVQKSLSFYVYCDLVKYQVVGDTLSPLLRVVPIRGEVGAETFIRPYYFPVNKGYISSIQIRICSEHGQEIQFQSGAVILIIHLRKCGIGN